MRKIMVVRHKIRDYSLWKPIFDESEEKRREYGLKGGCINRNLNDPSELVVTLEIESVERATEFMKSPYVKTAMEKAGVLGEPVIYFLESLAEVPELTTTGKT